MNMNLSIGGKRFYDSDARLAPTTVKMHLNSGQITGRLKILMENTRGQMLRL